MSRRVLNRLGISLAWACGLATAAAVCGVIGWVAWKGIDRLSLSFITHDPQLGTFDQGVLGGVRGPIAGTLIVTAIGIGIALPVGVGTAVFLTEFRRPELLARIVGTSVDLLFGVPAIVFAIVALAFFTSPRLSAFSAEVASSGRAYGRSFLVAGIVMSLLALPPITRATQESIDAVPLDLREASYALGKGRLATIRRVILPGARQGIATGTTLGAARIAADTAVVYFVLGGGVPTLSEHWYDPSHWSQTLHESGPTLTSYIYYASPAGEGSDSSAALGAAFVLILLMLLVNAGIDLVAKRRRWW